jgi:hypothetical protein
MDRTLLTTKLFKWLIEFVEKPNPNLGNWPPCPFARQARVKNKIEIVFSDVDQLTSTVLKSLSLFDTKDVVVICFDHLTISATETVKLVSELNELIMPKDFVILEDHPDDIEHVNGVCMNFGECGLLLLSPLSALNLASDQIKEKGYYKHWSQENIDSVVTWRYKQ